MIADEWETEEGSSDSSESFWSNGTGGSVEITSTSTSYEGSTGTTTTTSESSSPSGGATYTSSSTSVITTRGDTSKLDSGAKFVQIGAAIVLGVGAFVL
jgi:hypothetical protein